MIKPKNLKLGQSKISLDRNLFLQHKSLWIDLTVAHVVLYMTRALASNYNLHNNGAVAGELFGFVKIDFLFKLIFFFY
jgi:hypothetical protein